MSARRVLLFGVLAVLVVRVWLARATEGTTFSDNAVVALMAMHILRGKFYAIYWGQTYMGSLEAYGVAPFFALLGVSDFALSLGLVPWSVFFACGLFCIARRMGGDHAGAIAMGLAALAPPYLLFYQVTARGGYPETLAFGTLLVLLCFRVVYDRLTERSERWHLITIGFVAGLAFWTNWLIFPYFLVVGLYLLLHDPRLVLRSSAALALVAFFVGSAPLWLFNLRTGFPTFAFLANVQPDAGRAQGLQYAVGTALPQLIGGLDEHLRFAYGWPGKLLTGVAILAACGLALALWPSWLALARGRVDRTRPSLALVLLVVSTVATYSVGDPGRFHVARYLLPATTATIPLIALGLVALFDRSRLAGGLAIAALLTLYGAEVRDLHHSFTTSKQRAGSGKVESLLKHVLASGIRYGYADYGDATITTYLARDRVVLVDYHGLRYPSDEANPQDPAVIVRDGSESADPTLRALNAHFTKTSIPGYSVYWPIRYDGVPRRPLQRREWKAFANEDSDDASAAIDDDPWTYWSVSSAVKQPSFTVDLGKVETVTGVYIDNGDRNNDFFRHLRVEASKDGVHWTTEAEARWGFPIYFNRRGVVTTRPANVQYVLFAPLEARWLRLTRLKGFREFNWSIGELAVFGMGANDVPFQVPEFAEPTSPAVVERRLRLQSIREPENDAPLVELRHLYRSLGDWEKLREVERTEARRFRPTVRADRWFGRDLKLLGYDWRAVGPRRVEITYYWQAMRAMDEDYAVYLRLRGGGRLLKHDHFPGAGQKTTKRWIPEEIVKDVRGISIPADFPDAAYEGRIGVWTPRNERHVRLGRFGWWGAQTALLFRLNVGGETVAMKSAE